MQPPPTAADLLATVAQLLDDHVVPSLSGPVQHQTRVAASLVAIVERELRLGAGVDDEERNAWTELLAAAGHDHPGHGDDQFDLATLRAEVADVLRRGDSDVDTDTWDALMHTVRGDLRISKPGHDSWDGD